MLLLSIFIGLLRAIGALGALIGDPLRGTQVCEQCVASYSAAVNGDCGAPQDSSETAPFAKCASVVPVFIEFSSVLLTSASKRFVAQEAVGTTICVF